jgi:hypothetical protein
VDAAPSRSVRTGTLAVMGDRADDVVRDLRRAVAEAEVRDLRGGRHRAARSRRSWARVVVALVAGLVLCSAAGTVAGRDDAPPVSATPTARAAPPESWSAVLRALDQRRSLAFADGDATALREVAVAGSDADRADSRVLRALAARGVTARGMRMEVVVATVEASSASGARLTVVDRRSAYDLVDRAGRVVHRVAARGDAVWTVELRRVDDEWRVARVRPG